MKIIGSSIISASGTHNNKVVGGSSGDDSGGRVGKSNRSKNWLILKFSKSGNSKIGNLVESGKNKAMGKSKFLTSKARKVFNHLK